LRDGILVVGAAHVDVLADYGSGSQARLDRVGSIRFSVGGTAYNIAINLGQMRIPVEFVTILRRDSFPSFWISQRLEAAGVSIDHVQNVEGIQDSGFVAIRRDRELEMAVTASAIESQTLPANEVDEAIQRARLVVLDCNLPQHEIARLLEVAHFAQKPTAVAVVSDSKVTRLVERENKQRYVIDIVAMNERELEAVRPYKQFPTTKADATEVCELFAAKTVIVTRAAAGHAVLNRNDEPQSYPAPSAVTVVSSTGAGDALMAGVLSYWYRNQRLDFGDMLRTINSVVGKVLQQEGATAGALASETDFPSLARLARKRTPVSKRMLSPEVATATGILLVIFALLAEFHSCHHVDSAAPTKIVSQPPQGPHP
jgi:pseudouridine kinase